jgi:penicillin-binding protein 2
MATSGSIRSRRRLIVVQALVLALFGTLFVRLYDLQVVAGEGYQAQAADQSVRDIVVQPQRGLVVDAQGRPLVNNRPAWQISLDRNVVDKLGPKQRTALVRRVAAVVDQKPARIEKKLVSCGQAGAVPGTCWNGSPYQPVPVAADVGENAALQVLEQQEDYPGVVAEQVSLRSYPEPFGINLAHVLGYLSPITSDEYDLAQERQDSSLNGASSVGRAGLEKQYDQWLRGVPGSRRVQVDSMGRVLGDHDTVESTPGDTLVTSIDAKVQAELEKQLAARIAAQRQIVDKVTGRTFEADSGAAVVLETQTGRVVAMASQPTYDPGVWVGGISEKELKRLYSEEAGTPLLSRVTQGQFAPGSTWKPFMTAGALENGYSQSSALPCSSGYQVGNRVFKNYESGAYGSIGFAKALAVSCNTFFYRIGHAYWQQFGSDVSDVDAKDPLVAEAKEFGFGARTGIDLPGEAPGRIADRTWKREYYESQKDYYCGIADKPQDAQTSDFVYRFAREFCLEGYAYRAGDAVNFAIGQGDTIVTPLQLARGYAAFGNGGKLFEPTVAKAVVSPEGKVLRRIKPQVARTVDVSRSNLAFIDSALAGVAAPGGTMNWKLQGFPLEEIRIRAKTGSAEVYGKQSTGWVASYNEDYVVVMMISQGGTGSGSVGEGIRAVWETLYGVEGESVDTRSAAVPGVVAPEALPTFTDDGSILPPARKGARNAKAPRKNDTARKEDG